MLPEGQDWAGLCRDYRLRHGLKQEAMAQDFRVDQSTVSRWERGTREPSMAAKQAILNDLAAAEQAAPADPLQLLLEASGSAVALWDRDGVLRACSRRFRAELACGGDEVIGRTAKDILGPTDIMERVLAALEPRGFFEGRIPMATISFTPFFNPDRRAAGGLVTATTVPFALPGGGTGMLCIYDHDVLADAPETADEVSLFWVDAGRPLAGSIWLSGCTRCP